MKSLLPRTIKYLAVIALSVSGAVLGWRALYGPFRLISATVNSPLNAQSVFGLAAIALLLLNSNSAIPAAVSETRRGARWLLAILLVTVVTLWRALDYPLVFDDYTLVRLAQNTSPVALTYSFTHPGGDGFFRPVGYLSLHLDALWAGLYPFRWHLTGLVLHLVNTVLLWRLAGSLLADQMAALWAAALFAIHGTVLLTPTYLAARFDVLSALFILAAVLLYSRYLDTHSLVWLAASLGLMFMGLLTKETAFTVPLLITLVSGRKAWLHRRALAAFYLLAAVVFAYRYSLIGGIGGYRDPATGAPDILRATYLGYLKGFGLRVWSAFFFPVNWSHPPEAWLKLALLTYLGALGFIVVRARGPRRIMFLSLMFTGISLLPLAHLLLVDSSLLGAGRFYLALTGFAMLLGVAVRAAPRRMQGFAGAVLIVFQLAALNHNLAIWGETAALAERTCATAASFLGPQHDTLPAVILPRDIDGIPFLGNGFDACVALSSTTQRRVTTGPREFIWDSHTRELVVR